MNKHREGKIVNIFKQILIGGLFSLMASNAMALVMAPITGTLEMTGSLSATVDDKAEELTINFTRSKFITTSADGDFSGVGRFGDIVPSLDVSPFSGPISDFLTIDAFSFELIDLALVSGDIGSTSTFLTVIGNGILSGSGFTDTDAIWRLSAESSGGSIGGWSATLTAQESDVPEPGILALLSLGLITMVVRRRMIK
jgi:PEP-CTERM motif